jgi:glycosyltransferase involved in cell wall biosynthesis
LISFIVPAYNEAFEIGKALDSIFASARAIGHSFEVVVANDASTDQTPDIARKAGARVVDVSLHRISSVRNAGARAAKGDVLFFIDADTRVTEKLLRAALSALDGGAVGGGAWVGFSEPVGWFVQTAIFAFDVLYMGLARWAAGCFIFARRQDFEAVGGFNETLYATEEIVLSKALKQRGRFVIVRQTVRTSARKMRMYSPWNIIPLTIRLLLHGPAIFRQREGLWWWYGGKREE